MRRARYVEWNDVVQTIQSHVRKGHYESVNNLQWLVGPGAYVAFRNKESFFGATGIIGLDYKFEEAPINITLDWKPELNLISTIAFESSGIGLSIRYTFK